MSTKTSSLKSSLDQLETTLGEFFGQKAPAMPENFKETLVSFAPYLATISIVLSLPAILAILGIGALMRPFSAFMGAGYMMSYGVGYYVGIIGLIIAAVFEALAIPGLFKRALFAWKYMYYAQLVGIVAAVFQGNLGSALVSTLIGMYILFQVKSMYK